MLFLGLTGLVQTASSPWQVISRIVVPWKYMEDGENTLDKES